MTEGEPLERQEIKPGTRVAVIKEITPDGKVILYGFGVYEGNFLPPIDWGVYLEDVSLRLNPRIRLDSGQTVWGDECWWVEEGVVLKETPKENIIFRNIDEDRSEES